MEKVLNNFKSRAFTIINLDKIPTPEPVQEPVQEPAQELIAELAPNINKRKQKANSSY